MKFRQNVRSFMVHIISLTWSSDAVMRTGSVGWKPRARTPSKWLRRVYLALHVLRKDSLGAVI